MAKYLKGFAAIAALALTASCAQLQRNWNEKLHRAPAPEKSSSETLAIASLDVGETYTLKDGKRVTAEKKYTSLTGDECLRLSVEKDFSDILDAPDALPTGAPVSLAKPGRAAEGFRSRKLLCKHDGTWRYYPVFGTGGK